MAAAAAVVACDDPTSPASGESTSTETFRLTQFPADTVRSGRGVVVAVQREPSAAHRGTAELSVIVDPGTPTETRRLLVANGSQIAYPAEAPVAVTVPAGDGAHTIVVRHVDDAGRVDEVRLTRRFRTPTATYGVAPLLGPAGEPATANGLNDPSEAAGWTNPHSGTSQAVTWRRGSPVVLALPDSVSAVVSARINARGEVVALANRGAVGVAGRRVVRWSEDGVPKLLLLPPPAPAPPILVSFYDPLNRIDLTDGGRVLYGTSVFDPAAGTWAPLAVARPDSATLARSETRLGALTSMNERGDAVGMGRFGLYMYREIATAGVVTGVPAPPDRATSSTYGRWGFGHRTVDDEGRVLREEDAGVVTLSFPAGASGLGSAATATHLDEPFGPGPKVVMSRRGGVLAAFQPLDSTLYLWRAADRTPRQVIAGTTAWQITGPVRAVNVGGAILVDGRERATGRTTTLLLTPPGGG